MPALVALALLGVAQAGWTLPVGLTLARSRVCASSINGGSTGSNTVWLAEGVGSVQELDYKAAEITP